MSYLLRTIAVWVAIIGVAAVPARAAGVPTAIFPFDLIDDSQEGEAFGVRADQTARLELVTGELNKLVAESGRYAPVDMGPIAADVAKAAPIYKCNGCEDALAKRVGARIALIGTVQKVSNLILNINLYVRDVEAGRITKEYSVDVRGNTNESWLRSLRYLVKNRLLAEGEGPK